MKYCKTCGKDITALDYFIHTDYCSKECKDNHKDGEGDIIKNLFGIFNKNAR